MRKEFDKLDYLPSKNEQIFFILHRNHLPQSKEFLIGSTIFSITSITKFIAKMKPILQSQSQHGSIVKGILGLYFKTDST